ncbi:MAG: hypothetical protein Rhirs2KO_16050 [Rhizobiaceae bacterium]
MELLIADLRAELAAVAADQRSVVDVNELVDGAIARHPACTDRSRIEALVVWLADELQLPLMLGARKATG